MCKFYLNIYFIYLTFNIFLKLRQQYYKYESNNFSSEKSTKMRKVSLSVRCWDMVKLRFGSTLSKVESS